MRWRASSGPLSAQLSTRRLNNDLPYGQPRFAPQSFDEAAIATWVFWDLLDAIMFTNSPKQLYATGYVRELQIRRMIELMLRQRSSTCQPAST